MNDIQEKLFLFFSISFVLFLFILQKDRPSIDPKWKLAIPNIQIEHIRSITVSTQEETFVLRKDKDTWRVHGSTDEYADAHTIKKVLNIFLQVECVDDITNAPREYGLQSPTITFDIDGKHLFKVGDQTPTHEGTYIFASGRQCRTKTNIYSRIPKTFRDYRSTKLLFSSISMIETIELPTGVIVEKVGGNWFQRVPLTVSLRHEKIDAWLESLSNERLLSFLEGKPEKPTNKMIITTRNENYQFEWSNDGKFVSTHHKSGFLGTKSLVDLVNVNPMDFYETMLLPNTFHNKKIMRAEHRNTSGKPTPIGGESSFWRHIQQPVFARVLDTGIRGKEQLILYFEDDTKLVFSCARNDGKVLLSYPLEDVFILAPQDFLPSEE